MDNWSVENIVTCNSEDNCKSYNKEYIDLLEAVILWDNLYYPENEYSTFWKYFGQDQSIKKIIKPLQYAEVDFADEIEKILKDVPYLGDFKEIVAKGAIKYLLLSNKNGLNYYPCEKRSIFLEQNNFLYNLLKDKELINRLELMRIFDGEIIKYYEELNNFFKKIYLHLKFPYWQIILYKIHLKI